MNSDLEEKQRDEFDRWLTEKFFEGTIESETDEQILFRTNEQIGEAFVGKLTQLESMDETKAFLSYGIAQTTLDDVYLRIASESESNEDEDEERRIGFDEHCSEMFDQQSIEEGFHFYFNQYEGLFIKSCRLISRRWIPFLCICIFALVIEYSMRNAPAGDEILVDLNNSSTLNGRTLFSSIRIRISVCRPI
jgi:hypothetical protein